MIPTCIMNDNISNKHIYCMRDIYYTCEPPKLECYPFCNTLVLNDL